jgi:hypothetical protein
MTAVERRSKYFPLFQYLQSRLEKTIELSFEEIEDLLQTSLPNSAYQGKAFWSNRASGGLQAKAWMDAGYHVIGVDFQHNYVTFGKPSIQYEVRRAGDTILWSGSMVHALRIHLDISQAELSTILGVRQQTISEWENNIYQPTRSRSKHLHLIAERAGFDYLGKEKPPKG